MLICFVMLSIVLDAVHVAWVEWRRLLIGELWHHVRYVLLWRVVEKFRLTVRRSVGLGGGLLL